jgi:hypothetical protein
VLFVLDPLSLELAADGANSGCRFAAKNSKSSQARVGRMGRTNGPAGRDINVSDADWLASGDPRRPVEAEEMWTFARRRGGQWLLSAIQQI